LSLGVLRRRPREFDSFTARDLANLIDETSSMRVWVRLHPRDFEIRYGGGTYNPDFLAAENGDPWVIEAKADRGLATMNVPAKRRAAQEWPITSTPTRGSASAGAISSSRRPTYARPRTTAERSFTPPGSHRTR
jgi:hypothetical protein